MKQRCIFLTFLFLAGQLNSQTTIADKRSKEISSGVASKHSPTKKEHTLPDQNQRGISASLSPANYSTKLRGAGMMFTQNKGQIIDIDKNQRPEILFKGEGGGADVYLRKTGISYVYSNCSEILRELNESAEELAKADRASKTNEPENSQGLVSDQVIKMHRVDMDFANCNKNSTAINEDEVEGYNNYYLAHCPNGITNVKQYNKVTYESIYNNIDVSYYSNRNRGLKYDIIVKPFGNTNQIKLQWTGAENIHINGEGNLVIKTSLNEFHESIPKVYQNINGEIIDVKAKYLLKEIERKDHPIHTDAYTSVYEVSFIIDKYDPAYSLIIDPTWITYYGGSGDDGAWSVTTDAAGDIAFTGHTLSTNFPVSPGAFQVVAPAITQAASVNLTLVKMNSNGTRMWATYYGELGTNGLPGSGLGIAADAANNILVAGNSCVPAFPIGAAAGYNVHKGALTGAAGYADAFLLKFDMNGVRLFATFYGGTGDESGNDVATDGNNIYLYGTTRSTSAISTTGSFQPALNGATADCFVAKFAANGNRIWGTYIGGTGNESCGGITCDPTGNIYIGGTTSSTDFPVIAGHQMTIGGSSDAFLFKFDTNGTRLWATYYGGTSGDNCNAVATDGLGNIVIAGATSSPNAIATAGAYQVTLSGGGDAFVTKFNNAGVIQWGTYLGGSVCAPCYCCAGSDYATGVACDVNNNVVVAGDTYSTNFPSTSCAVQPAFAGSEDQFITTFRPTGSILCSSFLGIGDASSPNNETKSGGAGCIAVYGCYVYLVAATMCSYPVTSTAYQSVCGGSSDGALAKLYINSCGTKELAITINKPNNTLCVGGTLNASSNYTSCDIVNTTYSWTFTGGTPAASTLQNPTGIVYSTPGIFPVKVVVSAPCGKDSLSGSVIVNTCAITATASGTPICPSSGTCTNITATGTSGTGPYTYSWNTGALSQTTNVCPVSNATYTVLVTDANGNTAYATTSVIVRPPLTANSTSVNIACTTSGSASVTISSGIVNPYTFSWSNGTSATTSNATSNITSSINSLAPGGYTVTINDGNGCSITKVFNITSTNPVSAAFTNSSVCKGSLVNFTNTGTPPGSGITYNWLITPPNVSGTTTNFSYTFTSAGTYSIQHSVSNGTCSNTITKNITIINCSGPSVTATGSSACPGSCATVTASGTNGTAPYTFSWSNGSTTQNISPCPASTTTYTVTIRDAGGNTSTSTAVVTINPAVTVTTTSTNISCNGGTNGYASATGGSGTSPYTYNWSGGVPGSGFQVSGLSAGTYTVTVTDNTGCTSTSTTTIISPLPLSGQFTKGTSNCIGCGCKEWLMVNATGGTSPYTYSWPDGYVKRYKNQLCPGVYSINIKDKNGCSANINLTVP